MKVGPKSHWQRQRHWFIPQPQSLARKFAPALQRGLAVFQCSLAAADMAWLWQHRVAGRAIFPGAAMFEAVYQSAWVLAGHDPPEPPNPAPTTCKKSGGTVYDCDSHLSLRAQEFELVFHQIDCVPKNIGVHFFQIWTMPCR